ncbi:MAG: hypothetical protein E7379_03490 [Clostridiales bacterium]|nr:hypothetical protein [Clostridiales bacterium]
MAERIRRKAFYDYQDCFDGFTEIRKELNGYLDKHQKEKFLGRFEQLKQDALNKSDVVAMDVLAYYYKIGAGKILPENYMRYIAWEFIAAARGNEFAIEKLQFLIGYACNNIIDCDSYETIEYKNDIDEFNILYVLGKNICKIMVRDFLSAFPIDLVALPDEFKPYTKEDFINLRKMIDSAIPKTIDFLKS